MSEKLNPIRIIRASAGTGKTYRLATEFHAIVSQREFHSTKVIATTFTNKAARELVHRFRRVLLKNKLWTDSQEMLIAPIGTVNSVCGRIVSDLAIEAGLSPSVKIISEEQQSEIFNMAVEEVMNSHAVGMWHELFRMGMENTWRNDVLKIVDLARQNNFSPERLSENARVSWDVLAKRLPAPNGNMQSFESNLIAEMRLVLSKLPGKGDDTDATRNAIELIAEIDRAWAETRDIPWSAIIRITKLYVGRTSIGIVNRLKQIARDHVCLPGFHNDLRKTIFDIFDCAAGCLRKYESFKAERGLLDFIDQELMALRLLTQRDIQPAIEGRFSALLVDEFQDTSPIQLQVFLELAKIVDESIWVGDEKQSIYGFRGSDPLLLQEVVRQLVPNSQGDLLRLATSYRARPVLVDFVNCIFSECCREMGIHSDDVRILNKARHESHNMNGPLHVWWLTGSNQSTESESLASTIHSVLENRNAWLIFDAEKNVERPIRGSDIAILCRTNSRRLEVAAQLSRYGVLVSTERVGLMQTPECILATAVLRFLSDRYDTLAMAEIIRYTQVNVDERAWLYEWLDKGSAHILATNSVLKEIELCRSQLFGLTPVESFQLAISAPFVLETIMKWGDTRQRLLNLDALLGIARLYEEYCYSGNQAATAAGLVNFLTVNSAKCHQSANPDENAVQILTYHKSKGLEWPMVVMCDLGTPSPATPFGIHIDSASVGEFDVMNPLANRAIRYWPWPYGPFRTNLDLMSAVSDSEENSETQRQHKSENLRLLYVGLTRARDYLVFACSQGTGGTGWLDLAIDSSGNSLFDMSVGRAGNLSILSNAPEFVADCSVVAPDVVNHQAVQGTEPLFHFDSRSTDNVQLPYSSAPSSLQLCKIDDQEAVLIEEEIYLGRRLDFSDSINMQRLGDALHCFFAADSRGERVEQLSYAEGIARRFGIGGLSPEKFVEASNRLQNALELLYPDAVWHREWPVYGRRGNQRISGVIDLLLEMTEGFVIVDHKSFPGNYDSWLERAVSYYPQIDAYAQLVEQATNRAVVAKYIHLPIIGKLLKLTTNATYKTEERLPVESDNWLVL